MNTKSSDDVFTCTFYPCLFCNGFNPKAYYTKTIFFSFSYLQWNHLRMSLPTRFTLVYFAIVFILKRTTQKQFFSFNYLQWWSPRWGRRASIDQWYLVLVSTHFKAKSNNARQMGRQTSICLTSTVTRAIYFFLSPTTKRQMQNPSPCVVPSRERPPPRSSRPLAACQVAAAEAVALQFSAARRESEARGGRARRRRGGSRRGTTAPSTTHRSRRGPPRGRSPAARATSVVDSLPPSLLFLAGEPWGRRWRRRWGGAEVREEEELASDLAGG
jgi:hypothetical protein